MGRIRGRIGGGILYVGGCRSGKSALALHRAEALAERRVFIATARPGDAGMLRRVERHRAARGQGWRCIETPVDLPAVLEQANQETTRDRGVLLIDCVPFWLVNLMERGLSTEHMLILARRLADLVAASAVPIVLVTQECGCGVAPATELGNRFRDLTGEANQILAARCREVILVSCGLPLTLKGS